MPATTRAARDRHTAGPWIVPGHAPFSVWAGDVQVGHAPHDVEDCPYLVKNWDEREANARLMAAAPDLLETLLCIAGEASGQHADPLSALAVIEGYARAAITKATGG